MKELIKKITPKFLLKFYHYSLSLAGAVLYGFPSKNLKVIGVTGTSGKTTSVDLISKIFGEAGKKTASLSSIRFRILGKEKENKLKMTMPGRTKIQKFLKEAQKSGCEYVVLETTSEGIAQYRHKFINFDTAVFLNLFPEHLEAHGGFENYRNAKLELFRAAKNKHIVNVDDENAKYFIDIPAKEKWGYGIKDQSGNLKGKGIKAIGAENLEARPNGVGFEVQGVKFNLNLFGGFNVYNALAAIAVALSCGISLDICKKALEKTEGIPGRMEIVIKEPYTVIVDYAHTPSSLEEVYKTLTGSMAKGRGSKIICVLGSCGGGRDKWKRPVMGEIAAKYCGEVIITNEDPYDEDPMEIINQVAKGAGGKAEIVLDRREAIKKALGLARPEDAVVITGKGCEPWMCVEKSRKIPWDDRKIVKEEFSKTK